MDIKNLDRSEIITAMLHALVPKATHNSFVEFGGKSLDTHAEAIGEAVADHAQELIESAVKLIVNNPDTLVELEKYSQGDDKLTEVLKRHLLQNVLTNFAMQIITEVAVRTLSPVLGLSKEVIGMKRGDVERIIPTVIASVFEASQSMTTQSVVDTIAAHSEDGDTGNNVETHERRTIRSPQPTH